MQVANQISEESRDFDASFEDHLVLEDEKVGDVERSSHLLARNRR